MNSLALVSIRFSPLCTVLGTMGTHYLRSVQIRPQAIADEADVDINMENLPSQDENVSWFGCELISSDMLNHMQHWWRAAEPLS